MMFSYIDALQGLVSHIIHRFTDINLFQGVSIQDDQLIG